MIRAKAAGFKDCPYFSVHTFQQQLPAQRLAAELNEIGLCSSFIAGNGFEVIVDAGFDRKKCMRQSIAVLIEHGLRPHVARRVFDRRSIPCYVGPPSEIGAVSRKLINWALGRDLDD